MAYKNWTFEEFCRVLYRERWMFKIKYKDKYFLIGLIVAGVIYILDCDTADSEVFYGSDNKFKDAIICGNKLKDIFDDVIIVGNSVIPSNRDYIYYEGIKVFTNYCNKV